jgi:HemY protein
MIRLLLYLLVVLALGLGFAWLAERPGTMVITFGGYQYEVSLMVAAVLVTAVVAAVMIIWWLVKSIWNSPQAISRYFRVRRRDRGYQALSSGLIAAGAGDATEARRLKRQAGKLLSADQEPLLHLLEAQALLLEGDHRGAREKFEAMLDDPELRLIGLRGLYLEAQRLGEREAARHYAEKAAEAAPQLGWASMAAMEARAAEGDWDGALRLAAAQHATRQAGREEVDRRRAVLLTAKAIAALDGDAMAARNAGLEAHRLAPDLVPAAVTAARALFRLGDLRKGVRILETAWKRQPHPEIADAYITARTGDSTHDRLARARKLRSLKPNHVESELAVARAALAAGEYAEARRAAEAAIRLEPRESAFLILADIEEAETGDQGRIRHWLQKAVRAPRDPAWVADGHVSERWAPLSPVTGRLDAFEWRQPAALLGPVVEAEPAELLAPPERRPEPEPLPEPGGTAGPGTEMAGSEGSDRAEVAQTRAPAEETGISLDERRTQTVPAESVSGETPKSKLASTTQRRAPAEETDLLPPGPPDDPGVEPEAEGETRRFRLF